MVLITAHLLYETHKAIWLKRSLEVILAEEANNTIFHLVLCAVWILRSRFFFFFFLTQLKERALSSSGHFLQLTVFSFSTFRSGTHHNNIWRQFYILQFAAISKRTRIVWWRVRHGWLLWNPLAANRPHFGWKLHLLNDSLSTGEKIPHFDVLSGWLSFITCYN